MTALKKERLGSGSGYSPTMPETACGWRGTPIHLRGSKLRRVGKTSQEVFQHHWKNGDRCERIRERRGIKMQKTKRQERRK